LSSCSPGAWNQ